MRGMLIDVASAHLQAASLLYSSKDANLLQLSAFHLHQALEKALCQLYDIEGEQYPAGYNIATLIEYMPVSNLNLTPEMLKKLNDNKELYMVWEEYTTNPNSYMTSRRKVQTQIDLIGEVIRRVSECVALMHSETQSGTEVRTVKEAGVL